jgi:hypothetical protein
MLFEMEVFFAVSVNSLPTLVGCGWCQFCLTAGWYSAHRFIFNLVLLGLKGQIIILCGSPLEKFSGSKGMNF